MSPAGNKGLGRTLVSGFGRVLKLPAIMITGKLNFYCGCSFASSKILSKNRFYDIMCFVENGTKLHPKFQLKSFICSRESLGEARGSYFVQFQ